jgi:hypothetical protein
MVRRNTKVFFIFLVCLILIAVGYRFKEYLIDRSFILELNTVCDPKMENCFNSTTDLSFGQNPYEKVKITASYAPKCLEEHDCDNFSCPTVLKNTEVCEITYCSDTTKVDGENCTTQTN